MFIGEYHPTIDDKGRVAIPVRLRRAYGDDSVISRLIITHGFDKCIMAFREADWTDFIENRVVTLPQSDPKNRMRMRFILGGACECELDRQGRIVIPGYLMEYAEIKTDVTVLGMYNRIEVWATDVYDRYRPTGEELNSFAVDLGF